MAHYICLNKFAVRNGPIRHNFLFQNKMISKLMETYLGVNDTSVHKKEKFDDLSTTEFKDSRNGEL